MKLATEQNVEPVEATSATMMGRRAGDVIAHTYRVVRHLASGGSSHVYVAEHVRLGKAFALKLLRPELCTQQKAAQRFRLEARALARIRSEYVVSIVDFGQLSDGTLYLVMDLMEGEDLRALLSRQGRLPTRRAVQVVLEACHGVAKVHEAGLVHRDLKPENLFITRRTGGEDWCKVLDFGVVKMQSGLATRDGAIIGTVRYMAPEQLTNAEDVGPATDVYALGAILYECLSGQAVHDGDTLQELMYRIMNQQPAPLGELCPSLPASLRELIERALSKGPRERPRDAAVLAERLAELMHEDASTAAHTTLPENVILAPAQSRSWLRNALLATATAGLGITVGWLAAHSQPAEQPMNVGARATTSSALPGDGAPRPVTPARPISPELPMASAPRPEPSARPVRRRVVPRFAPLPRATSSGPPRPLPIGRLDTINPYGD